MQSASDSNQILPQVNPATNTNPGVNQQPPPVPAPKASEAPPAPTYGGLLVRYTAALIDSFAFGIPSAAASFAIKQILNSLNLKGGVAGIFPGLLAGFLILPLIVYMVKSKGATPGKLFFNLRIVDEQGNLPNLKKAILREVLGKFILYIFTFGLVSLFSYFMVVFGSKKQAVHDKIAGTYVLLLTPLTGFKKFVIFFVTFLFPLAILGILAAVVLIAINPAGRIGEARDVHRKTDVGSIATSLQAYQLTNKRFPNSLQNLVDSGELGGLPMDPKGSEYSYSVNTDGSSASLYANLEKANGVWCWESKTNRARLFTSEKDCRP